MEINSCTKEPWLMTTFLGGGWEGVTFWPVCDCQTELRKQNLAQEPLMDQGPWQSGLAITYPPFRPILCCCSLQFTLQSLVTSPLLVCAAGLTARYPQDRETLAGERREDGGPWAAACPWYALVSPDCWQAWPGPPVSTWSMPFHFQASQQTQKPFQNLPQPMAPYSLLWQQDTGLNFIN